MKTLLTLIRRTLATALILFAACCCSIGLAWVLTSTPYGFETATSATGERLWIVSGLAWQGMFILCINAARLTLFAWKLTGGDMQTEFDFTAPTGDELKRQALDGMELKYPRWIDRARERAAYHAAKHGRVSINDIRTMIANGELPEPPHHNVLGSIFRTGFRKIGIEEVKHPSAHNRGGGVSVWGLA